jgi:hypothetical protein
MHFRQLESCPAERHSTYYVPYRPVTIYTWPSDGRDLDMNLFLVSFCCGYAATFSLSRLSP